MLNFGFYNMDCMDGMKQFPDKYFDLAIVDPPYGISAKGGFGRRKNDNIFYKYNPVINWDNKPPDKEYFVELFRVSKNQVIWGGNYFANHLYPTNAWIVWDKKFSTDKLSFSMGELAWTSFQIPLKIFYHVNNKSFSTKIHPTQKPIELYTWLLSNYAKAGDKILDTHVGSASSLIACERMGFQYVGFEIDEEYYKLASERLFEEKQQISWNV